MGKVDNMTTSTKASATSGSSKSEPQLVYKNAVEELRKSLTCTICLRLLHEPFTTACGHTFCYECLNRWFKENKSLKTCPDCRARVQRQPAQAFRIREMVTVICKDERLLPAGEGVEEHQKMREEITSLVEKHRRAESGLFQGVFKVDELPHAVYHVNEGIWRCPDCNQELSEDMCCYGCNLLFDRDGHPDNETDSIDVHSGSDIETDTDSDFDEQIDEYSRLADALERGPNQSDDWLVNVRGAREQSVASMQAELGMIERRLRLARNSDESSSEISGYYDSEQDSDQSDISGLIDDGDEGGAEEEEDEEEEGSGAYGTDEIHTMDPYNEHGGIGSRTSAPISIDDTEESSNLDPLDVQGGFDDTANFSDLDEEEDADDMEERSVHNDYGDEDEYGGDDHDYGTSDSSPSFIPLPPAWYQRVRSEVSASLRAKNDNETGHDEDDSTSSSGSSSDSSGESASPCHRVRARSDKSDVLVPRRGKKTESNECEETWGCDEHDTGDDENEERQENSETRRQPAKQKPTAARQSLGKRARVVLSDDSDDEDDDDVKPPSNKRSKQTSPLPVQISNSASTASTAPLRARTSSREEEDDEDEDEDPIPARRVRGRRTNQSRRSSSLLNRYGSRGRGQPFFSVRA